MPPGQSSGVSQEQTQIEKTLDAEMNGNVKKKKKKRKKEKGSTGQSGSILPSVSMSKVWINIYTNSMQCNTLFCSLPG